MRSVPPALDVRLNESFVRMRRRWQRLPDAWRAALLTFIVAKIVATTIGYIGATAGAPTDADLAHDHWARPSVAQTRAMSSHLLVRMWFEWDGVIYQDASHDDYLAPADPSVRWALARHAHGQEHDRYRFAFAPLYPVLIKAVGFLLGDNNPIAALLISNLAFLGLLVLTWKIALMLMGDTGTAERAVWFVALMPSAFLFQSGQCESLFVFLLAGSLYAGMHSRWWLAGLLGYFAALTHSTGLLVALPLALLLLQSQGWRWGRHELWSYAKAAIPLVMPILGWVSFMAYCKVMSGSWFAYNILQQSGWGTHATDPLTTAWAVLNEPNRFAIRGWIILVTVAVAIIGYRVLRAPLLAQCLIFVVAAFLSPPLNSSYGMLRYMLPMFPVAFVFATWARNRRLETLMIVVAASLQGLIFALWLHSTNRFIV